MTELHREEEEAQITQMVVEKEVGTGHSPQAIGTLAMEVGMTKDHPGLTMEAVGDLRGTKARLSVKSCSLPGYRSLCMLMRVRYDRSMSVESLSNADLAT